MTQSAHLNILTRDFHVIELRMMEFDEVTAALIQWLAPGSNVEAFLVRVSPILQAFDILAKLRHVLHEVFLDGGLDIHQRLYWPANDYSYLEIARQVVRELGEIVLCH